VNIYCGNISYDTSEDDLKDLFGQYGEVSSVRVIKDRDTGRSKGFGFVDMDNDAEAKEAIEALNEKDHMGRALRINEARPREER
jgi:RNA recognition motif-containing protein